MTMESAAETRRGGLAEIRVGSTCHVQTAENRFGPHVLEDLKAFVFEGPQANFPMDFDDDDDDDEGDEDDDSDEDAADIVDDWVNGVEWDDAGGGDVASPVQTEHAGGPQDSAGSNHHQQGFPRVARIRCNLTAMSQRFNLYFAAYQDKIYVFQPKKAPQILPPPSIILSPRRTRAARVLGGTIDRNFGHQMNSIMVGNLGNFEIVFFAFDDGDVGAYYTHAIARCIRANIGHSQGVTGALPRQVVKEFFHDNVGLSAWGLAIHEQSRLLAVSSNRHEITVFAFATSRSPARSPPSGNDEDTSPRVWSGQTALELEKHFQSRTRTWRIVLPTGAEGRNMPSISFCDDETGYADKVVAFDVEGNTWILDIWKIGSFPIVYPPNSARGLANHRYMGWGVLVLPDSSFKQVGTVSEALGLPTSEIYQNPISPNAPIPDPEVWLDITCSLFYVRDLAPDPTTILRLRHHGGAQYLSLHTASSHYLPQPEINAAAEDEAEEDDDDSDMVDSDSDVDGAGSVSGKMAVGQSVEQRWKALSNDKAPSGAVLNDLAEEVHLARTIVPSFGETLVLDGSSTDLLTFANDSLTRNHDTKTIKFSKAEFSPHMAKNMTMLRTMSTDVELQPFDPKGTGIVCKSVLVHYNHQGRRVEPWDLARHISERTSMLIHVPELNLVVAGALNGRVALLTLTKTNKRFDGNPVRRGFRVDWVLPRRVEEDRRLRPLCALHGIAMSPVPDPKARGLDLHGRQPRVPPVQYRLILHYMDHTILMYDIARRAGNDDLMIF